MSCTPVSNPTECGDAAGGFIRPRRGTQFVEALYRNSVRLSDLISDLLDVSRLESGQFEVRPH